MCFGGELEHEHVARPRRVGHGLDLDRAAEAGAKAQPLLADGIAVTLRKPKWANFEVAPAPAAAGPP